MTAPAKPSPLYPWDSNGTHVVVPTSGHQTDGYVADEVPGSGEVNGLQQNWWQELAWLDYTVSRLLPTAVSVPMELALSLSNMTAKRNSVLTASSGSFSFETGSLNYLLRFGDCITGAYMGHVLSHSMTVDFRSQDITGATHSILTTTITGVGTTTFDLSAAAHLIGPQGTNDNLTYYLAFTSTGGNAAGAGEGVSSLSLNYTHP